MLTLLLIITFTNFKIISGEDDNKFINSLPEKQKKEFIQTVEKRIQNEVPEVKSPDGNDTNVDLYEKRLEDQGQSIQNILRSEIDHIKSQQLRSANATLRQSAHIDLTLRTQPEGHINKNILFEKIPVAVQYDNENVANGKSSPNDTSAERKRNGRRSNDLEFENVTLTNPDVNTNKDAVDDTTTIEITRQVQDDETTKDAADIPVTRPPITQEVVFETTRQEVNTQGDDKDSITAQGKIITTTDALDSIKLDYSSSTPNNTVVSSTIDSSTFNGSSLTFKSIRANSDDLISSTLLYGETLQTDDESSNATQQDVNPHSHNVEITTAQYNLNNSTVVRVLTTTHFVDKNKTVIDSNITVNNIDSSTILSNVITTKYKGQLRSNDTTKTDFFNNMQDNYTDNINLYNGSIVIDNNTTLNKLNISHNFLGVTEPDAVNKVMYHNETTQGNVNDMANNQSGTPKLGHQLNDNILRIKSEFNDGKQKHNITSDNAETKTLGVFDNKHHIIISNKKLVDAKICVINDNKTLAKAIKAEHRQKGSKNTGNVTTNNTTIFIWYGNGNDVTESLHKTTRNVIGNALIHNSHKYNKTTKKLNNNSSSYTTHKESNSKKSRNTNKTIGFKLHVSDPSNTISDNEKQPKYVPVYNYDPENAYFKPNTERPWNGNVIENKVESSDPAVIKKTVTHSERTKLDIYANGNEKSLRIKDIKERMISASNTKIKQNSNLYETILGDDSGESSNEDVFYEKPLKHTLKKIREKIYKHQINDKSKDSESDNNGQIKGENKYKNEVRKNYSAISDKNEEKDIAEIFRNFGTLLQKLVDSANNNEEIPNETEKDSNEDVRSSDTDIYRDVAHSLESHNRAIKNKGIQKIVEELEKIQNNIQKKSKKNIGKHRQQSRFQVKDRDEKQKQVKDKIYRFVDKPRIDEDETEYENFQFKKAKAIKIKDDYLDLHANILKDLVEANDEGLQKYDWLGTTVLIQAGLGKLQDITERKILNEELDPLDEELLEFAMTLHKDAIQVLAEQKNERTTKRKRLSFRIPKPKKGKNFNALNRMYGEMSKANTISLIRSGYNIEDFREFLMCMRHCLNDLHTAIRQISFITTYKKQRWFKNLKQLYLNEAGEREYLELLLHFVSARLIGLIDELVKKVTREDSDFSSGDVVADRIEVEFVFTLKICNELSRLNG